MIGKHESPTIFASFKNITESKCESCKKNTPIIIAAQYCRDIGEMALLVFCKDCFKRDFPEYTLENYCIVCNGNFECSIQDLLFSKKEIKTFRREFYP